MTENLVSGLIFWKFSFNFLWFYSFSFLLSAYSRIIDRRTQEVSEASRSSHLNSCQLVTAIQRNAVWLVTNAVMERWSVTSDSYAVGEGKQDYRSCDLSVLRLRHSYDLSR